MTDEHAAMAGVPAPVVRVQEMLAARSRLLAVRRLLDGPKTFADLTAEIPLSITAIRVSLQELADLGYLTDDSPAGRQRKTKTAVFTIDRDRDRDRDLVLRDLSELLLYLAR